MKEYIKKIILYIVLMTVVIVNLIPLLFWLSFKLAEIHYLTNANFLYYLYKPSTIFVIGFLIIIAVWSARALKKFNKKMILCIIIMTIVNGSVYTYNNLKESSFLNMQLINKTEITAHRGDSEEKPENSLPAFESALNNMVDYVELDVRLTKDNVPVIFHDNNMSRITGADYNINELYFCNIKIMDAGSWFNKKYSNVRIPTLEETIIMLKDKVRLNIEIKPVDNSEILVDKVLALINYYHIENKCIITSSDYDILKKVKISSPKYRTGYILKFGFGHLEELEYADIICLKSSFVTRSIVTNLHKSGKEIHVWTVNDSRTIKRMVSLGVDNIITDNITLTNKVIHSNNGNSYAKKLIY